MSNQKRWTHSRETFSPVFSKVNVIHSDSYLETLPKNSAKLREPFGESAKKCENQVLLSLRELWKLLQNSTDNFNNYENLKS